MDDIKTRVKAWSMIPHSLAEYATTEDMIREASKIYDWLLHGYVTDDGRDVIDELIEDETTDMDGPIIDECCGCGGCFEPSPENTTPLMSPQEAIASFSNMQQAVQMVVLRAEREQQLYQEQADKLAASLSASTVSIAATNAANSAHNATAQNADPQAAMPRWMVVDAVVEIESGSLKDVVVRTDRSTTSGGRSQMTVLGERADVNGRQHGDGVTEQAYHFQFIRPILNVGETEILFLGRTTGYVHSLRVRPATTNEMKAI